MTDEHICCRDRQAGRLVNKLLLTEPKDKDRKYERKCGGRTETDDEEERAAE